MGGRCGEDNGAYTCVGVRDLEKGALLDRDEDALDAAAIGRRLVDLAEDAELSRLRHAVAGRLDGSADGLREVAGRRGLAQGPSVAGEGVGLLDRCVYGTDEAGGLVRLAPDADELELSGLRLFLEGGLGVVVVLARRVLDDDVAAWALAAGNHAEGRAKDAGVGARAEGGVQADAHDGLGLGLLQPRGEVPREPLDWGVF